MRPTALITVCLASHRRIIHSIGQLDDEELEPASLLPGWHRADVIAWLALKSESHVHLFDQAASGQVGRQFAHGYDQDAAIRAAVLQGATQLRANLAGSFGELEAAWDRLPDHRWTSEGITSAGSRSMTEIVARHLRDVEVHHVDLDIGYTPADWPADFVELELAKRLRDRRSHRSGGTPRLAPRSVSRTRTWSLVASASVSQAPLLTGHGFVLRVLDLSDAAAWKAGEDPEQIRWFEAPGPAPMENIVNAIRRWRDGWEEDGPVRHWGIWVGDQLAGGVELRVREDGRANVSYVIFPTSRRKGLASEAVRLLTDWAFAELRVSAVVAIVNEANIASRGVAEKAGFRPDGRADPWEYSESGVMLRYLLGKPE